jgi:hypothetical protein
MDFLQKVHFQLTHPSPLLLSLSEEAKFMDNCYAMS